MEATLCPPCSTVSTRTCSTKLSTNSRCNSQPSGSCKRAPSLSKTAASGPYTGVLRVLRSGFQLRRARIHSR